MREGINETMYGLKNANQLLEGVITAGQPDEEQFERLATAGYKTVIDLREPGEDRGLNEPETVRSVGMEYVNIPVGHENIDDESFEKFQELLADVERRPILVHCTSANRVGALLIPYLVFNEGKSVEAARKIASQVGLRSAELERSALRYVSR